jgi:hypothetical protein
VPPYVVAALISVISLSIACSRADTPTGPSPSAAPVQAAALPAAISVLSGDAQPAKAGEHLTEPFAVRVTDARRRGVQNVLVSFQIASGAGLFNSRCEISALGRPAAVRTDADGVARTMFYPSALGRTTVTAQADGLSQSVTFAIDPSVLVIDFWFGAWYAGFTSPCSTSSTATVPVGTTVEWKAGAQDERYSLAYTVTSTSTPAGGRHFDSGMLTQSERFRFVPEVSGTWEYRDQLTGSTGTLRAQ